MICNVCHTCQFSQVTDESRSFYFYCRRHSGFPHRFIQFEYRGAANFVKLVVKYSLNLLDLFSKFKHQKNQICFLFGLHYMLVYCHDANLTKIISLV